MEARVIFAISVLMGVVVWGLIAARYIWPALRLSMRSIREIASVWGTHLACRVPRISSLPCWCPFSS
jgi:hypothetical protein